MFNWSRIKEGAKELWLIAANNIKADFIAMSRISIAMILGGFFGFIIVALIGDARTVKSHHDKQVQEQATIKSQQATINALNEQVSILKKAEVVNGSAAQMAAAGAQASQTPHLLADSSKKGANDSDARLKNSGISVTTTVIITPQAEFQ